MNLAILSLYVTPMPPIKFWLSLIYSLGGNVVLKNFKLEAMVAILDIGKNRF